MRVTRLTCVVVESENPQINIRCECEWLFVSISQACDGLVDESGLRCDSWDGLQRCCRSGQGQQPDELLIDETAPST